MSGTICDIGYQATFQPVLDCTLAFDNKITRSLPGSKRKEASRFILGHLEGFLEAGGMETGIVPRSHITYGLRIAAEYGGNNGEVLDKVTELARLCNSYIVDRGDKIEGVHLFDNNKPVGYHRIP